VTDTLLSDSAYRLWVLLSQVDNTIFKAREKELRQIGISPEQAAALFIIQVLDNKGTPAEISRWLLRRPHTVSGLLSRMEKKGLLRKTKDLKRGNLVRVSLTEKGQQVYNQSSQLKSVHDIMSSLSEERRQQLISYLLELRAGALEKFGVTQEPPFP